MFDCFDACRVTDLRSTRPGRRRDMVMLRRFLPASAVVALLATGNVRSALAEELPPSTTPCYEVVAAPGGGAGYDPQWILLNKCSGATWRLYLHSDEDIGGRANGSSSW